MPSAFNADLGNIVSQAKGFNDLASNLQDKIASRAVVTLKRRLGPEANRQLSGVLNLSTRQIGQRVTVTSGPDYVDLTASGKRVSLAQFGGKYGGHKSPGATAQVYRDDSRKTYVSAFTIKGGGAILARQLQGAKRAPRTPVIALFGPDAGSVLIATGEHEVAPALLDFSESVLDAEVPRLIQVEIDSL